MLKVDLQGISKNLCFYLNFSPNAFQRRGKGVSAEMTYS